MKYNILIFLNLVVSLNVFSQTKSEFNYSDFNEKSIKHAVEIYNKHNVGDEIKIFMLVDILSDGSRNAVIMEYDDSWVFDPKKDLIITGIITKKYFYNSETNVFFNIMITKMNYENTRVLLENMKVGNEYDFNLDKLRIE